MSRKHKSRNSADVLHCNTFLAYAWEVKSSKKKLVEDYFDRTSLTPEVQPNEYFFQILIESTFVNYTLITYTPPVSDSNALYCENTFVYYKQSGVIIIRNRLTVAPKI